MTAERAPLDLAPFIEQQQAVVADFARWTVPPRLVHVWDPWDTVKQPAPLDIPAEHARLAALAVSVAAVRATAIANRTPRPSTTRSDT